MSWSVHVAIRSRREMLGLSQSDLARALGVTKSLLSLIEAGKRQPTVEQIRAMADVLQMPPDLLLLGVGRLPDDIRGAFAFNAAAAVAAIRQHTEAHALDYPIAPSLVLLPKKTTAPSLSRPLPERMDVNKTSASYRAHSYHTKVPPEAIQPFIRAFTRPGETILDPFCGSGMTGVAALLEGRAALLSDISPAAVHIARNYTSYCDPRQLEVALASVERIMNPTVAWLYRPVGKDRLVEYTTWSDVYRCPSCRKSLLYWDVVKLSGGTDGDRMTCSHCGKRSRKAEFEWLGEQPVQSHTSAGSNRIDAHQPTAEELALIEEAARTPIPYWIPDVSFGSEREMWRAAHRSMGISNVSDFFTRRNLHALAALRHAIVQSAEGRVREALMFAFTAAVNRASRRYQWNAKRPTNVMTGTLYISSLRYEWNVWSLFSRKAADVLRYYRNFPRTNADADVFQCSATDLGCLPDRSIDMVFMDPPFGSNIFYGDSSLLWEAWLGQLTDTVSEIVVNKHRAPALGGKRLEDYGDLMCRSFAETARVLKRGGRAILAFSNSDGAVWHIVQDALAEAGFKTSTVHLLNKGQPSIKGVKGVSGKENVTTLDLIICLQHRGSTVHKAARLSPPSSFVDQIIQERLAPPGPAKGARTDEIYSAVVKAVVEANYSVAGVTMPAIAARCSDLGATQSRGCWILPKVSQNADFVQGYLSSPADIPRTEGGAAPTEPLGQVRVSGGRNTALYTAHSYHTKVPPESIVPFVEHYTKPGDVVLDPFCGSGMTGVASILCGRKAILNDLSPAAVHLAWNHTRPCDPQALGEEFAALEWRVKDRLADLYSTTDELGEPATIHWTLWSTRHRCPNCAHEFLLWDVMDQTSGRLGKTITCPGCKTVVSRKDLETLGSEPAWLSCEARNGKRFERAPTLNDIDRALRFSRNDARAWHPTTPLSSDREMYIRCALQLQGVGSVADLYTPRNILALSLLWEEIQRVSDERMRRALAFAFTNTAWHGTRMRRYNARGGQRPLTGTLYIPQLSSEANVLEVMRNKIDQLQRYYHSFRPQDEQLPAVLLGSATDLRAIPDASVDYVFTDPPFGSNIFYADCNLIWESWLGRVTDVTSEAVVNRSLPPERGGKSLNQYAALIGRAMAEIARVLKPGGWATVVFHNTDGNVWQAIRDAAEGAGFLFHEAASLDRRQQSHKGYKGRSESEDVAHFDVVFNFRKPEKANVKNVYQPREQVDLEALIATLVRDPEIARRGLQGVHAEVMRRLASEGNSAFVDYAEVRAAWSRIRQSVAANMG